MLLSYAALTIMRQLKHAQEIGVLFMNRHQGIVLVIAVALTQCPNCCIVTIEPKGLPCLLQIVVLSWGTSQRDMEIVWKVLSEVSQAYSEDGGRCVVVLSQRAKLEMEGLVRSDPAC